MTAVKATTTVRLRGLRTPQGKAVAPTPATHPSLALTHPAVMPSLAAE